MKTGSVLAGRYRLVRALGSGATSTTWEAEDPVEDRFVALKLLSPDQALGLREEFDHLAGRAHPNLAEVYDFGYLRGGRPFYTSRLVQGVPLSEGVAPSMLRQVVLDVASALTFLHRSGLRHGDVKPDNILVEAGRAVLIDLGCASPFGVPEVIRGTPRFLAPELASGERTDGRADLYALGMTVKEVASRTAPTFHRLVDRLTETLDRRASDADEVAELLGAEPPMLPRASASSAGMLEREAHRERFREALGQLREGRGQCLSLIGPPGAGRSRLIRELQWEAQREWVTDAAVGAAPRLLKLLERQGIPAGSPLQTVEALGGSEPRVWLVDDADALDDRERSIVDALSRQLRAQGTPALLLVTAGAAGPAGAEELSLNPLTRAAVETLASGRSGTVVDALLECSQGLPSRLLDLIEAVGAGATAASVQEAARRLVSLDREDAVRLAGLEKEAREQLLRVAAAGGVSADQIQEHRSLLRGRWLLRRRGRVYAPAAAAVLKAADPGEVREAHRAVAPQHSGPRRVAHLACAGELDEALACLAETSPTPSPAWRDAASALAFIAPGAAGELYLRCGAPRQAEPLLRQAGSRSRSLAESLLQCGDPAGALRVLDEEGAELEEPAVVADLRARCFLREGRYAEVLGSATRGLDASPSDEVTTSLLATRGIAASYLGDHDLAERSWAEVLARHPEPRAVLRVRSYQAIDAFRRGDRREARDRYADALHLADEFSLDDQVAHVALNLGTSWHHAGDWGAALRFYERGRGAAIALGQEPTLATIEFNVAKLHSDVGALPRARDLARRARTRCEAQGLAFLTAACDALLGEISLGQGRAEEAVEQIEGAARQFKELGATREVGECFLSLAEPYRALGDALSEAQRKDVRDAIDSGASDLQASLSRVEARADLDQGDAASARTHLEGATSDDPPEQAKVAGLFAQVWDALDAPTVAAEHRSRARLLWERIAATLPSSLRDLFWQHPERRGLAAPMNSTSAPSEGAARELEKMRRLLSVQRRLSSSLDSDEVLRLAMDAAVELTGAERGFLVLKRGEQLTVPVARNLDRERIGRSHSKFSRTIAEKVFESGEPVLSLDARTDDRFEANESVHAMKLRSVLAVPLLSPEGPIGALYLDNRFHRGRFQAGDVELLEGFADQLAIALRNAELLEELQQRTRELETERRRVEELSRGQAAEIDRLVARVESQRAGGPHRHAFHEIVGRSAAMRAVLDTLDRVIDSPLSVLVTGESGTGKELVARAIHYESPRGEGPFVPVNCGALPDMLLESELFGHVRGAFTGADRDKVGLMEAAEGGTLFLDELGEMSLAMQVKLLRALEAKEIRPVGGTEARRVDFRLVTATNRDLEERVERGEFRADLFYRVGVVAVRLPPLRERLEDLPELCRALLVGVGEEFHREAPTLAPASLRHLLSHDWPGNVRELLNALRAGAVLGGSTLLPEHLVLRRQVDRSRSGVTLRGEGEMDERAAVLQALEAAGGRVDEAASELGVSRATFYRRMKRHGIAPRIRRR